MLSFDVRGVASKMALKEAIKIPDAAKSCRHGNLGNVHRALLQQISGGINPDGIEDLRETGLVAGVQHPTQMGGGDSNMGCGAFQSDVLRMIFGDIQKGFSVHIKSEGRHICDPATFHQPGNRIIEHRLFLKIVLIISRYNILDDPIVGGGIGGKRGFKAFVLEDLPIF